MHYKGDIMEYILKNGIVYDPANEINGEKMDVMFKDGKIVESGRRKILFFHVASSFIAVVEIKYLSFRNSPCP